MAVSKTSSAPQSSRSTMSEYYARLVASGPWTRNLFQINPASPHKSGFNSRNTQRAPRQRAWHCTGLTYIDGARINIFDTWGSPPPSNAPYLQWSRALRTGGETWRPGKDMSNRSILGSTRLRYSGIELGLKYYPFQPQAKCDSVDSCAQNVMLVFLPEWCQRLVKNRTVVSKNFSNRQSYMVPDTSNFAEAESIQVLAIIEYIRFDSIRPDIERRKRRLWRASMQAVHEDTNNEGRKE